MIVIEICPNGDAHTFLRGKRDSGLPVATLLTMSADAARGLEYLASKRFVHRDFAARNMLVANDLSLKVTDFGMSRKLASSEYYRKDGQALLPVRWLAPECLMDGLFTPVSDLWSLGVVIWEIFTFAQIPYQTLSNQEVFEFVSSDGDRMKKPAHCPAALYEVVLRLWLVAPGLRPSHGEVLERVERVKQDPAYAKRLAAPDRSFAPAVNSSVTPAPAAYSPAPAPAPAPAPSGPGASAYASAGGDDGNDVNIAEYQFAGAGAGDDDDDDDDDISGSIDMDDAYCNATMPPPPSSASMVPAAAAAGEANSDERRGTQWSTASGTRLSPTALAHRRNTPQYQAVPAYAQATIPELNLGEGEGGGAGGGGGEATAGDVIYTPTTPKAKAGGGGAAAQQNPAIAEMYNQVTPKNKRAVSTGDAVAEDRV